MVNNNKNTEQGTHLSTAVFCFLFYSFARFKDSNHQCYSQTVCLMPGKYQLRKKPPARKNKVAAWDLAEVPLPQHKITCFWGQSQ